MAQDPPSPDDLKAVFEDLAKHSLLKHCGPLTPIESHGVVTLVDGKGIPRAFMPAEDFRAFLFEMEDEAPDSGVRVRLGFPTLR